MRRFDRTIFAVIKKKKNDGKKVAFIALFYNHKSESNSLLIFGFSSLASFSAVSEKKIKLLIMKK